MRSFGVSCVVSLPKKLLKTVRLLVSWAIMTLMWRHCMKYSQRTTYSSTLLIPLHSGYPHKSPSQLWDIIATRKPLGEVFFTNYSSFHPNSTSIIIIPFPPNHLKNDHHISHILRHYCRRDMCELYNNLITRNGITVKYFPWFRITTKNREWNGCMDYLPFANSRLPHI